MQVGCGFQIHLWHDIVNCTRGKFTIMKQASNWIELLIENVADQNNKLSKYLVILLVLFIGAGSLYMLLNTTG